MRHNIVLSISSNDLKTFVDTKTYMKSLYENHKQLCGNNNFQKSIAAKMSFYRYMNKQVVVYPNSSMLFSDKKWANELWKDILLG
jgi:hypothetical protein